MTLNGPALEKAAEALRDVRIYGARERFSDEYAAAMAEAAVTAYRDALPQSGVAARLLGVAAISDTYVNAPEDFTALPRRNFVHLSALLREAATLISGVELPGWRAVKVSEFTDYFECPKCKTLNVSNCCVNCTIKDRDASPPPPVTGDAP